jgi:hypothetical protein
VLIEQERQGQANIVFVIDKKQTKALSRLSGASRGLGWTILVFFQSARYLLRSRSFGWTFWGPL